MVNLGSSDKLINVLLISPKMPQSDPRFGGDHAYTEMLLTHPPEGVRYFFYEDLIAGGEIRTHRVLNALVPRLVQYGVLPPDVWAVFLVSNFVPDLIHVYGFSAHIAFPKRCGSPIPLILSQGTGGASDLLYYLGWNEDRARRARRVEALVLKLLRIYNSSLNPGHASRILVWSEFSRQMHLWDDITRPEQMEILRPGLVDPGISRVRSGQRGITFLFIGRDFARKNGHLVLEAFRRVRASNPHAYLHIIGNPPGNTMIVEDGIVHERFVTRRELYARVYPQADVLVLPSRAEGFGLVLLEAMSFGMPVIGIDAWAMPEVVNDEENGFLIPPNSVTALADRMSGLVNDADLLATMGQNSKRVFLERFSIDRHNRRLREIYLESLTCKN